MRVLEEVLKKAEIKFSDIERILVCTGPRLFYWYKNRYSTFKRIMFIIYANNDQIYMGAYNSSFSDKGRKIVECAGNIEECLEELYFKLNVNKYDFKKLNYNFIVFYDEDTKQQGKEVIKGIKKLIEQKILECNVIFKEVIVDNRGFEKRIKDINSGKYDLENDEIKREYEIIPNYLKKSQAKRLLEKNNKN